MEAALLECNNQVSFGVFFTLFTGVRIGELCGLKWGDIDFDKAAVSYIFDENGSAVQHRVLCFYIGSSAWHETQNFVVELDGVRFFDLYV